MAGRMVLAAGGMCPPASVAALAAPTGFSSVPAPERMVATAMSFDDLACCHR